MLNRTSSAFAALIAVLSLSACNTVEGVGEDVESLGNAINDAAEESQN